MPAAGLGQPAGSLAQAYRGMIQLNLATSKAQTAGMLPRPGDAWRFGGRIGLDHPDISVANEIAGSQTGSQRPQAYGHTEPRPAILAVTDRYMGAISLGYGPDGKRIRGRSPARPGRKSEPSFRRGTRN